MMTNNHNNPNQDQGGMGRNNPDFLRDEMERGQRPGNEDQGRPDDERLRRRDEFGQQEPPMDGDDMMDDDDDMMDDEEHINQPNRPM